VEKSGDWLLRGWPEWLGELVASLWLRGLAKGMRGGGGVDPGSCSEEGVGVRVSSPRDISEGVWLGEVLQPESASDVFRAMA
jgi:hypothetical protein